MDDEKVLMYETDGNNFSKAIRLKCLDCCADVPTEVKRCQNVQCPLFPFRFGCRPKTYIERNREIVKIVPQP